MRVPSTVEAAREAVALPDLSRDAQSWHRAATCAAWANELGTLRAAAEALGMSKENVRVYVLQWKNQDRGPLHPGDEYSIPDAPWPGTRPDAEYTETRARSALRNTPVETLRDVLRTEPEALAKLRSAVVEMRPEVERQRAIDRVPDVAPVDWSARFSRGFIEIVESIVAYRQGAWKMDARQRGLVDFLALLVNDGEGEATMQSVEAYLSTAREDVS